MPDLLLPLSAAPPPATPVCVVLVDLTGSTMLAQTLPLTHYMALMTEFVQVMILSFEARGGTVLQHQGDAVLGYWPAQQSDDACRVALEAHDRAARLGLAGLPGGCVTPPSPARPWPVPRRPGNSAWTW
jgi:adenylate cyclase